MWSWCLMYSPLLNSYLNRHHLFTKCWVSGSVDPEEWGYALPFHRQPLSKNRVVLASYSLIGEAKATTARGRENEMMDHSADKKQKKKTPPWTTSLLNHSIRMLKEAVPHLDTEHLVFPTMSWGTPYTMMYTVKCWCNTSRHCCGLQWVGSCTRKKRSL